MKIKPFLEMFGIFLLFTITLIPGLLFVDILAHEYYHYLQHKESAIEICFDFNSDSEGHLGISVPKNSTEGLNPEQIDQEEKKANIIGKTASIFYFLIAILALIWLSHVFTRIEK